MEAKKETKKTTKSSATAVAKKAPVKKAAEPKATVAKKAVEVKEVKVPEVKAVKASVKKEVSGPSLKITLVKSASGRLKKQQRTLIALGLRKINGQVIKPDNACTRGMIFVVKHLVAVEEIK